MSIGAGLAFERASANEDGEQEDKFDKCESDEHSCLELTDSFWLSSHALHSAVSDEAEANAASNSGHSECEWEHVFLVSFRVFPTIP
jgi:hypothetical protein